MPINLRKVERHYDNSVVFELSDERDAIGSFHVNLVGHHYLISGQVLHGADWYFSPSGLHDGSWTNIRPTIKRRMSRTIH